MALSLKSLNPYPGYYPSSSSTWHEDRDKAKLIDPEGQVHRMLPIPKKWKIKYASGYTKPAETKAAKLSLLQTMISGNIPSSFDNRQTRQTKAASSPDKITVDFHTDAIHSDRIPKRVSIVTDSKWNDFLNKENSKRQSIDDDRFRKEVEDMRTAKRLRVLEENYRRRGIVIYSITWIKCPDDPINRTQC